MKLISDPPPRPNTQIVQIMRKLLRTYYVQDFRGFKDGKEFYSTLERLDTNINDYYLGKKSIPL